MFDYSIRNIFQRALMNILCLICIAILIVTLAVLIADPQCPLFEKEHVSNTKLYNK